MPRFFRRREKLTFVDEDRRAATRLAFEVPIPTYQRVFERTTRGLYFFHTGNILQAQVPAEATMLRGTPNLDTEDIRRFNIEIVGDGAFVNRFDIVPTDPEYSIWIYEFHQAHWALVRTGRVG